jgi:hypothetical protein
MKLIIRMLLVLMKILMAFFILKKRSIKLKKVDIFNYLYFYS